MWTCQFCQQTFTKSSNLYHHQRHTKACLEIQGRAPPPKPTCQFCGESYSTPPRLRAHEEKCDKRPTPTEEKMAEEIQQLRTELDNRDKYSAKLLDQNDRLHHELQAMREEKAKHQATHEVYAKQLQNFLRLSRFLSPPSDAVEDDIPLTVAERMETILEDRPELQTHLSTVVFNEISITSRQPDHYVNALEMCRAGERTWSVWKSLESTQELVAHLSRQTGLATAQLIEQKYKPSSEWEEGTWIHPDLAIALAYWISPSFGIEISQWIRSNDEKRSTDLDLLKRSMDRIQQLEQVCLSKKRRLEYKDKNVVYLLTTDDHLKRRTYIIGKAKNLTTRLGTYNKTCDHTVVYHRECPSEEDMSIVETMILRRLHDYREQSNRDRVILPIDQDVSFFTTVMDDCVEFVMGKK